MSGPQSVASNTDMKVQTIALSRRCWLWLAAWAVTIGIMAIPFSGDFLKIPWLFPIGFPPIMILLHFVTGSDAGYFLVLVGWLFYLALTIYGLRQNKRIRYLATYTILCVCLVLNMGGCYYIVTNVKT